ncbi:MAG TPA: cyclic nucleotide-binding domain-containing protein [Acidimicrobiia bacterium]
MAYDDSIFQTYLAEVPMFRACTDDELEAIAYLASPRSVDAGTALIRQGETGDEFFVLMMGTATVSRDGHDVANLEPGDYFGELSLFDQAQRDATITADVPVTVAVMDRNAFQAALDAVPALRDSLLRGMARRLHELDARA